MSYCIDSVSASLESKTRPPRTDNSLAAVLPRALHRVGSRRGCCNDPSSSPGLYTQQPYPGLTYASMVRIMIRPPLNRLLKPHSTLHILQQPIIRLPTTRRQRNPPRLQHHLNTHLCLGNNPTTSPTLSLGITQQTVSPSSATIKSPAFTTTSPILNSTSTAQGFASRLVPTLEIALAQHPNVSSLQSSPIPTTSRARPSETTARIPRVL